MIPENLRLELVLIFFIYGLAFFGMGLALTLESWRMHRLVERRLLRPLAIFGLLHGAHEWLEIVLIQGAWQGDQQGAAVSEQLHLLRVVWLAVSFLALVWFGVSSLANEGWGRDGKHGTLSGEARRGILRQTRFWVGSGSLGVLIFVGLVLWVWLARPTQPLLRLDVYSRYFLAVPGGLLAGLALLRQAGEVHQEGRSHVAGWFRWAAVGFFFYGLTQLWVSPLDIFPARWLNTQAFQAAAGFPIQLLRAAAAVLITAALIRAVQVVERERELELDEARNARLAALERIQHELTAREALRRDLLRHVVLAQEDERARIARELHDETAQIITALSLDLATLREMETLSPRAGQILQRLQNLSRQMSQGVYHLIRDLRPAQLDELGLVSALRGLADEEQRQHGLAVEIKVSGEPRRLDPLVETVFFRVAQEGVVNVIRHAGARRAALELVFEPERTSLHIRDQGCGFDPAADFHPPRGWGLAGMRERCEAVGGRFQIESVPGRGTHLQITVPQGSQKEEEQVHGTGPVNAGG